MMTSLISSPALRTDGLRRGDLNRLYNLRVPRAPAQVSSDRMMDLCSRRVRNILEEGFGREDHSRSAVAALDGTAVDERLLEGIESVVGSQPFDGDDLLT